MHARRAHHDVERGRAGLAHGQPWRVQSIHRYTFALLLLLTLVFMYLVSRGLKNTFRGPINVEDTIEQSEGAEEANQLDPSRSCTQRLTALGLDFEGKGRSLLSSNAFKRKETYSTMDGNIAIKGLFLGGVITQGLKQADLYNFTEVTAGHVTIKPVLKPLDIPVRAMILPLLDEVASQRIRTAVETVLMPALPAGSIWLQDDKLYHSTLFHASSHVTPVPATAAEVELEAEAIRGVTHSMCPIKGVLDRIVITTSGVIVACWQVLPSGTDPADLRQGLAQALPKAPSRAGQMVKEPTMLHTTIARLLQPPEQLHTKVDANTVAPAVQQLSSTLCGLTTTFDQVWFIEEQDLLALALEGRYIKHPAQLACPHAARWFG